MTNEQLIRVWYERMWNQWDKSVFSELLTDDIAFRGSFGDLVVGHAGVASYMDKVRDAFPDFRNHVEEIIAQGDKAFARLRYTGTHHGKVFGIEPTGVAVEYVGAAVFGFCGEKIHNVWVLGDVYGLIQQLRASPLKTANNAMQRARDEAVRDSICPMLRPAECVRHLLP